MGPLAILAYQHGSAELRRRLAEAMHIELHSKVHDLLLDLAASLPVEATFEFSMPARIVAVEARDAVMLFQDLGDEVAASLVCTKKQAFGPSHQALVKKKASYVLLNGRDALATEIKGDPELQAVFVTRINICDLLFSLMNEPRLIEKVPPSRQQKRAAQRVLGDDVPTAWTTVRWTVGDKVAAKADGSLPNFRMPLHFCRGHWMYLPDGRKGDEWCPIRKCWRSWRGHHWRGHPDYGVRLHDYRPEIEPDGASADVISLVRKRANAAARKAAIRAWEDQHARRLAGRRKKQS